MYLIERTQTQQKAMWPRECSMLQRTPLSYAGLPFSNGYPDQVQRVFSQAKTEMATPSNTTIIAGRGRTSMRQKIGLV